MTLTCWGWVEYSRRCWHASHRRLHAGEVAGADRSHGGVAVGPGRGVLGAVIVTHSVTVTIVTCAMTMLTTCRTMMGRLESLTYGCKLACVVGVGVGSGSWHGVQSLGQVSSSLQHNLLGQSLGVSWMSWHKLGQSAEAIVNAGLLQGWKHKWLLKYFYDH